jgi:hypothetical protein
MIEPDQVAPFVLSKLGLTSPQIDGALVAIGYVPLSIRDVDRCWQRPKELAQFALTRLQPVLRPLSLCDIDVDADQARWASVAVVGNEATRLDPPRFAVCADKAILDVKLAAFLGENSAAEGIKAREIGRMHTGSPFLAGKLFASLRQPVNGRMAR